LKKFLLVLLIIFTIKGQIYCLSDLYVINSENFEVYIKKSLLSEKDYIMNTLEKELKYISEKFCFKNNSPIKVFIEDSVNTGGANADPLRSDIRVNYFFDYGAFLKFNEVIRHELTHVVQFHKIGDGSGGIKYLLRLGEIPLWFYEGYAESFSRDYNPYWDVYSYLYPLYTPVELQTFYYRDNYNRVGGYFASFEIIEYLKNLYGEEYIALFLCGKGLKDNFKSSIRKKFGIISDIISESRSFLKNRTIVKYPNSYFVFKESEHNLSQPNFTLHGLYYISTDKDNRSVLKFNDKIILENIHSYSIYKENEIIASIHSQGRFKIVIVKQGQIYKTDFLGIYPFKSEDYISFMDNRGYVNVYKENKLVFKNKGQTGRIKDKILYYIDMDDYLCFYYFSGDFNRKVLKLKDFYAEISFFNDFPVISEYIDGEFTSFLIKDDKRKKLFNAFATNISFFDNAVYFSGINNQKRVIFKKELPK